MFKFIIMMLIPIFAFASSSADSGWSETDSWRAFNFFVFLGIIYYFLADRAKAFFANRKNSIAKRLDDIQNKLKESTLKKEEAIAKVEEAKVTAKSYILTSEKENRLILDRLNNDLNNELENLEKTQKYQMEIEKRKVTRTIINEVLDELFDKNISIDKNKLVDIVTKKVS